MKMRSNYYSGILPVKMILIFYVHPFLKIVDIIQFCGEIPVVLFANKVDLIDEDDLDDSPLQDVVKINKFLGYYVTSAKTGKGVVDAFNAIIHELYNKYKPLSDLELFDV